MLQSMRNNLKGTVAFIIIGILIIPLALVGIEGFNRSYPEGVVVQVNDEPVSRNLYSQKVNDLAQQYPQLTREQIGEIVLEQLVVQKLMQQQAREHLAVSDERVKFQIDELRKSNRLEAVLRGNNMSLASLADAIKDSELNRQLSAGLFKSSFTSEEAVAKLIGIRDQKRDITWVELPMAPELAKTTVSEEEIKTYYEANKADLLIPAKAKFEYAEITPKSFKADITDEVVENAFQDAMNRYRENKPRKVAHLFISNDNPDAQSLIQQISAKISPDNFNALVEEYSDDLANTDGVLGVYPQVDLSDLYDGFKDLSLNEVSAPFVSAEGTHFLRVLEIGDPSDPVPNKEKLKQELVLESQKSQYDIQVDKFKDVIYSVDHIADYTDIQGLDIKVTDLLPPSELLQNVGLSGQSFTEQDLTEDKGKLIRIGDRSVAFKVLEYNPPKQMTLEEARENIVDTLKRKKASEALAERAKKLLEDLKAGNRDESVTYRDESDLKRDNLQIRPDIIQLAFNVDKPSDSPTYGDKAASNGDHIIVMVKKVENPTDALEDKQLRNATSNILTSIYSGSEQAAWLGVLKSESTITYPKEDTEY